LKVGSSTSRTNGGNLTN